MIPQTRKEVSDEELWKTIPFAEQIEIDIAIDRGSKTEAVNRCMCSGKGFTLSRAVSFIERRKKVLPKKI
ncbi:MAG TPA: hypothetical protein VGO57_02335 [Verrucomicrobiae bacterium]|jgi:hypothetical protein